jgi:hypothetical protein
MFIPDPDFYPFRITDLGSRIQKQQQKRGVNKNFFFIIPFCVATNIKNIEHYQYFGFGIRDPRSRIRKNPIPDPGSRSQKGTGSWIRIRNTEIINEYNPTKPIQNS